MTASLEVNPDLCCEWPIGEAHEAPRRPALALVCSEAATSRPIR